MNIEKTEKEFLKAYDENVDALFRQCYFKVHNTELAQDLLQETFTRTWDYLKKGKEIVNMKAFLYKTINNLVIDEYRKKKPVSLDVMSEDGFDPEAPLGSTAHERLEGKKAMMLIDKLPEPYKQAVFLRYVNGLELKEIAEITREAENTISVHVHRGMNKLKELYKENER